MLQEQLAERQEARLLAAEALERERAAVLAQARPGQACGVLSLISMSGRPSPACCVLLFHPTPDRPAKHRMPAASWDWLAQAAPGRPR